MQKARTRRAFWRCASDSGVERRVERFELHFRLRNRRQVDFVEHATIGVAFGDFAQRQHRRLVIAPRQLRFGTARQLRSEEHTSELQSLMRISYAVFCLKKKINISITKTHY